MANKTEEEMKRRHGDTETRRHGENPRPAPLEADLPRRLALRGGFPSGFPASPFPRFDSFPIPRFPDSKKAGFTLIEIVIVILLIGILAAAIAPRAFRLQDSFKVEAAAEQIANHIRLAQSHAIARHVTHGVYFGTGTETYSVYSKWDSNYDPIYNPLKPGTDLEINFNTDSQLKGVTIESAQFPTSSRYSVEFSALGAPNYSGYVQIEKGTTEKRRIGVELQTGAVSVWTP